VHLHSSCALRVSPIICQICPDLSIVSMKSSIRDDSCRLLRFPSSGRCPMTLASKIHYYLVKTKSKSKKKKYNQMCLGHDCCLGARPRSSSK
jgi:hypothetical protein